MRLFSCWRCGKAHRTLTDCDKYYKGIKKNNGGETSIRKKVKL